MIFRLPASPIPETISLRYAKLGRVSFRCSDSLRKCLDSYEQSELAGRAFLQAKHCGQYIYSRLMLKMMLSGILSIPPSLLSIRTLCNGRPKLFSTGVPMDAISLSISHDRDRLIVAAGFSCWIGVDVQAVHGVEWPLVNSAMGWTTDIERYLPEVQSLAHSPVMSQDGLSALIWAGYEAWLKLSGCSVDGSEFAWSSLVPVGKHSVTGFQVYELRLSERTPYNEARVLLMLQSDEAIAVATL